MSVPTKLEQLEQYADDLGITKEEMGDFCAQQLYSFHWRCLYHQADLEPSGHSVGMGLECWPGMSYDYTTKTYSLDSSELTCPKLIERLGNLQGMTEEEEDKECDNCLSSWTLVPE